MITKKFELIHTGRDHMFGLVKVTTFIFGLKFREQLVFTP